MSDLTIVQSLPPSRRPIHIRPATLADVPFMDALQRKQTREVGWMPRKQFEGKIKAGHVLVAELTGERFTTDSTEGEGFPPRARRDTNEEKQGNENGPKNDSCAFVNFVGNSSDASDSSSVSTVVKRVGYLIGNDQYFKRDEVGIIYQINVLPEYRKSLVAAHLLKAQFDRSAYGCRLYCCWCAQDIAANRFWEAMGFVALAFRAGSDKKKRVHIFWSKRIREGDTSTHWWFPSQTQGGAMMEDRLVFPIPPGTTWSDAKPIILPRDTHEGIESKQLDVAPVRRERKVKAVVKVEPVRPKAIVMSGGLQFSAPVVSVVAPIPTNKEAPDKPKRTKVKNDPRYVKAARELRDRWLEQVNSGQLILQSNAKYDVRRVMEESSTRLMQPMKSETLLLQVAA